MTFLENCFTLIRCYNRQTSWMSATNFETRRWNGLFFFRPAKLPKASENYTFCNRTIYLHQSFLGNKHSLSFPTSLFSFFFFLYFPFFSLSLESAIRIPLWGGDLTIAGKIWIFIRLRFLSEMNASGPKRRRENATEGNKQKKKDWGQKLGDWRSRQQRRQWLAEAGLLEE